MELLLLKLYPLVRPRRRDARDLLVLEGGYCPFIVVCLGLIFQSSRSMLLGALDWADSLYSREWPPELGPASERSEERLFLIKESTDMDLRRECGDAVCNLEMVGEPEVEVRAVIKVSCEAKEEPVIMDSVAEVVEEECPGTARGIEIVGSINVVFDGERGVEPAVVPVIVSINIQSEFQADSLSYRASFLLPQTTISKLRI